MSDVDVVRVFGWREREGHCGNPRHGTIKRRGEREAVVGLVTSELLLLLPPHRTEYCIFAMF